MTDGTKLAERFKVLSDKIAEANTLKVRIEERLVQKKKELKSIEADMKKHKVSPSTIVPAIEKLVSELEAKEVKVTAALVKFEEIISELDEVE